MPSYLTNPIAGAYNLTFAAPDAPSTQVTLGLVGDRCLREIVSVEADDITGHALGNKTVIDGIYKGGNCFLEFTAQELNRDIIKKIIHPFSLAAGSSFALSPGGQGELGVPGTLMSAYAGILKATPINKTHAHQVLSSNAVRTYGLCLLANGHQIERFFENALQVVPVRFRCFPYDNSGKTVWYTLGSS